MNQSIGTQVKALLGLHFEGEGFLPTMKGDLYFFNLVFKELTVAQMKKYQSLVSQK